MESWPRTLKNLFRESAWLSLKFGDSTEVVTRHGSSGLSHMRRGLSAGVGLRVEIADVVVVEVEIVGWGIGGVRLAGRFVGLGNDVVVVGS